LSKFDSILAKEEITNEGLFIVKKMIEEDIESFKYFFNRYYSDLCNFVHVYLHDQILAEEIVRNIRQYWLLRDFGIKTQRFTDMTFVHILYDK